MNGPETAFVPLPGGQDGSAAGIKGAGALIPAPSPSPALSPAMGHPAVPTTLLLCQLGLAAAIQWL